MTLPYYPPNFRDVGDALALWLDPCPIPAGALLRGGRPDALASAADLGHPGTIINLCEGPDAQRLPGVRYLHLPAPKGAERYETQNRRVRAWIMGVLASLTDPATAWPVYVHCARGRDRTGVVIAATLLAAGIARDVVVAEYLLGDDVDRRNIEQAIDGLRELAASGTVAIPGAGVFTAGR